MPFRVLIVDHGAESRAAIERLLVAGGHLVTTVSGYHEAKQRLLFVRPDLLVTPLKLGAYNGIQLVLRARSEGSSLPAVVVHDALDHVLERETINAGAAFLGGPLNESAFVALVEQLLRGVHDAADSAIQRKWPRKAAGVAVAVRGAAVTLLDVSYGGLRLELLGAPDETLGRIEAIDIPHVGTIPIQPVWALGGSVGSSRWWCGAEVRAADGAADAWRRFVDSLA